MVKKLITKNCGNGYAINIKFIKHFTFSKLSVYLADSFLFILNDESSYY